MKKERNYSAGLCIYCTDCKKVPVRGKRSAARQNPIAEGGSAWIFVRNCERSERLQRSLEYEK